MFLRILQLICLFEFVINLTINNYPFHQNSEKGNYLLPNKNTQNIYLKKDEIHNIKWSDIIFISVLILLFLTILICLYYQRLLINLFLSLCSKRQTSNNDINEHANILDQIPPLKSTSSTYLTVPQPSYYHH